MDIFTYWDFDNASKDFMHGFKSAILAIFQFLQNGTFEPMHEIWNFFGQMHSFETIWKNIHNMSQGFPNPGFLQEKVQKGDFAKKSPC